MLCVFVGSNFALISDRVTHTCLCFSSQLSWPDCIHRTPSRFLLVFFFEWRNAVFFLLALVAYFGHPFVAVSLFLRSRF